MMRVIVNEWLINAIAQFVIRSQSHYCDFKPLQSAGLWLCGTTAPSLCTRCYAHESYSRYTREPL